MEYINLELFFNLERGGKKNVIDFCIKMGFIASSYECPECKKPMILTYKEKRNQDGFTWCCRHKNTVKRSIRSGSWFQDSRLSMIVMLKLAYLWAKRTPYAWIAEELRMSVKTICDWMAFFRRVCVNAIKKEGKFIGGPNEIVEIDAKSFSNIKNKQGQETWVFGGVERSTKNCFLEIIQTGEEDEIISILKNYVRPGTTIISDNWKGFDCLESNGYLHQKFVKTSGFKDSVTGAHKNNILSLWGRLKKIVSNGIASNQFDAYLAEIMYRRLHRGNTQALLISFFKILSHIFTPRVRDDPTLSKKAEMEKESKSDYIEPQLIEMNGNIREQQGESVCDVQVFDNEFIEEVEVPQLCSGDSSSGDSSSESSSSEDEGENGSQKKRQKTMESLDTQKFIL